MEKKDTKVPQKNKRNGRGTFTGVRARRNYKDTLFRMLFRDSKQLLDLYNAVNGTHYTNVDDLKIVTLENAVYMNMKNDLAFVMEFYLNLYEHQSTFNPNMPLRDLFYVAREYQNLIEGESMYASALIKIPTPRFVVFYNGTEKRAEYEVLKLSDAYEQRLEDPELELKVRMLNINTGNNKELLDQCRLLKEYMLYVECVRKYAKTKRLDEAVECAVNECIEKNVLREFLQKHRAEAIAVSIFEYDEEREKEKLRKAEYEAGQKRERERFKELAEKMQADQRIEELLRATTDLEYRDKLYLEYDIPEEKYTLK